MESTSLFDDSGSGEEDVESNTQMTTPRIHGSRTALRFGAAFAALAAFGLVGFVGLHVKTSPASNFPYSLAQLSKAHGTILRAFSERALQAATGDFTGSFEVVFKQKGATDPKDRSKMKMTATIKASKGPKRDAPTELATFIAKTGKEKQLKNTFKDILTEFQKMMCRGPDAKECVDWFKSVKLSTGTTSGQFGKGNFVFVEIPMPPGSAPPVEKDVEAAFKNHQPEIVAEIDFGRKIEEMWANKKTNIAELPLGIQAKSTASFASSLWMAYGDAMQGAVDTGMPVASQAPGMIELMPALAELKSRNDILYKPNGGGLFAHFPTLEAGVQAAKQFLDHQVPPKIMPHLKKISKFSDGIAGFETVGLPSGVEFVVAFENFHPSHLLSKILAS